MIAYKYRGLEDDKPLTENMHIKTMLNNEIYAPKFDTLNDPFETESDETISHIIPLLKDIFQIDARDIIKSLNDIKDMKHKLGLYSLSKDSNDATLWAYYANSSKGYCIGYDINLLIDSFQLSAYQVDVQYISNIPLIDITDILNSRKFPVDKTLVTKLFASKSIRWKHENEVRIIFESSGLKKHHPNALKSIHFGLNMFENSKNEMIDLLSNRDVDFYEMVRVKNTYEFESKLIHKNRRIINDKLDGQLFKIVKHKSLPTCENFVIFFRGKIKSVNEMKDFIRKFRNQYSIKPSNITIIDDEIVIPLVDRYDLSDTEYITLAEHLVSSSTFDSQDFIDWYPLQDSNYIVKGGKNFKK